MCFGWLWFALGWLGVSGEAARAPFLSEELQNGGSCVHRFVHLPWKSLCGIKEISVLSFALSWLEKKLDYLNWT